ncbi:EscU/YscU/HrcU family type III secretion system export apparatus switch protein [Frigidibacter sp. MR17.24]|uniref:EscU/YscU/HrcU family type III secretion system export apparatus switch protein n=1 Tax=Frigidibacter sp. MR17.24 TaxID=3127345 RepID=UPI003013114B
MAEGDEDKDQRSELPTEKRMRDAREKGDVPSSREAGAMMTAFGMFLLMVFVLPATAPRITGGLAALFEMVGQAHVGRGTAGLSDLRDLLSGYLLAIAIAAAPVFGVLILAAAVAVLIQGEIVVAAERIRPQLSRLSPMAGIGRLFSWNTLIEFAKSVTKVLIVGAVAVWIAWAAIDRLLPGVEMLPESLPAYLSGYAGRMLIGCSIFLVPVAILDIIWKRIQWMRKLRMTLQEVKDERKDAEGNPEIKAKRMQIRRRRAQQRIAQAVPTATMVLTNPTHYAVALRYDRGIDPAPVCVAKGADLVAARIRKIAHDNDIPVIENRDLARALHAAVEVDDVIPEQHWQAVAELVSFVIDLRRRIRRRPPAGSELRDD